ncbi:ras-related and estrogen-regulated growth inhibitor-like [Argopecten irradians]|uniref:ras-related and estrogen-regulated growth inhibitor-like n=1 Tax=Argopecten irradians TaxID=31199 RepID=UPI00371F9685
MMTTNGKSKSVDSRIVVLGRPCVGKSALVVRYLTKRFIWEYDPTLECTYKHHTIVDDEPVVIEILDTAGQVGKLAVNLGKDDLYKGPTHPCLIEKIINNEKNINEHDETIHREGHVRWADGFVLVYAINDRQSFEDIYSIKQYLDEIKRTNVQCILVGNKTDLLHERKISTSEGQKLAQDMACAFFETSASDGGEEICELFCELHREIKRRKMIENKPRRRSSGRQHSSSSSNEKCLIAY